MQFHHAHGFRPQVTDALQAEMPEAYERWLAAGAEPVDMDHPTAGHVRMGTRSRRLIFERALRETALAEPGLDLRVGHVDAVTVDAAAPGPGRGRDAAAVRPGDRRVRTIRPGHPAARRAARGRRAPAGSPTSTGCTNCETARNPVR